MVAAPPWGHHLILDVQGCDRDVVQSGPDLAWWVTDLVETIGMEAYGTPTVTRFGEDALAGLTVMQLITTSNVNAHFMDGSGDGYIDVFSCQVFDVETVLDHTGLWLRPQAMAWLMMERRAGLLSEIVGHGVRVRGAELVR